MLRAYQAGQEADAPADNARTNWVRIAGFSAALLATVSSQVNATSERSWNTQVQSGALGLRGLIAPLDFVELEKQVVRFTRQSSLLIKDIGDKSAREVEQLVQRAYEQKWPINKLERELEQRLQITERRAALIARDQTSKLNGNLAMVRQTSAGISKYTWRTQRDSRVRELHKRREGVIFSWDSPPSDGHPGQPIACRCVPEPRPIT